MSNNSFARIESRKRSYRWKLVVGLTVLLIAMFLSDLQDAEAGFTGPVPPSANPTIPKTFQAQYNAGCADPGALPPGEGSPTFVNCVPQGGPGSPSSGATISSVGNVLSRMARGNVEDRLEVVRCQAGDGDCRERETAASADGTFANGWGGFVAFNYEYTDRDNTNREAGFDSDTYGVTVGLDKMLTDYLVLGAAFGYMYEDGDFDVQGDFDDDQYSGYLYASVFPTDQTFVDLVLGYTYRNTTIHRPFIFDPGTGTEFQNVLFEGDPGANEYTIDLSGGYDFVFDGVTAGPRLGLNYTRTEIDSYKESGGGGVGANGQLAYDDENIDSLQSRLGAQASMAISTGIGVIVPQIGADWVHEFENDSRNVDARFRSPSDDPDNPGSVVTIQYKTDSPDRDWVEVSAGASLVLPNGFSLFANFDGQFANDLEETYAGTVGLRVELGGP